MPWLHSGATQYHAQLGLPDKGHAIKGLVVCNSWDLEPWELLNGLALGCYQPSPEELIVLSRKIILLYKINLNHCLNLYINPPPPTPRSCAIICRLRI